MPHCLDSEQTFSSFARWWLSSLWAGSRLDMTHHRATVTPPSASELYSRQEQSKSYILIAMAMNEVDALNVFASSPHLRRNDDSLPTFKNDFLTSKVK